MFWRSWRKGKASLASTTAWIDWHLQRLYGMPCRKWLPSDLDRCCIWHGGNRSDWKPFWIVREEGKAVVFPKVNHMFWCGSFTCCFVCPASETSFCFCNEVHTQGMFLWVQKPLHQPGWHLLCSFRDLFSCCCWICWLESAQKIYW